MMPQSLEDIEATTKRAVTTYVDASVLGVLLADAKGPMARHKVRAPIRVMRDYKYKDNEELIPCIYSRVFAVLTSRK